jgi:FkbM family methyltransferase
VKNVLLPVLGYLLRLLYGNKIKHGNNIVYTNSDLISNLTVALVYFHRYEKDEIRLCKKYLTSQLDIIELGTSIGVVALSIQQEIGVRKMICVEANHLLHGVLKKTFKHNNLKNIQLLNVAISDSNQPVYFSTRDSSELGKIVPHSEIKVNTKSLQQIIQENNILEYNLICDIEGAECSFILDQGLQNCQLAIIELHSTLWKEKRYSVEELSNMIQEKGFDLLECINSTFVFKRITGFELKYIL